jgi:hypothetical protein
MFKHQRLSRGLRMAPVLTANHSHPSVWVCSGNGEQKLYFSNFVHVLGKNVVMVPTSVLGEDSLRFSGMTSANVHSKHWYQSDTLLRKVITNADLNRAAAEHLTSKNQQ